jgi:hypothetical protein
VLLGFVTEWLGAARQFLNLWWFKLEGPPTGEEDPNPIRRVPFFYDMSRDPDEFIIKRLFYMGRLWREWG